jgi:predicted DCC family thiol-disulfide oxidoreductase YuxK
VDRPVALYDSDCGFCRVSLALILAWDRRRRLRPLALQEPEAAWLLPGMDEEERMSSWHLALPDGRVRSAGAAFEPMLRELPGGAPLAALAGRFPDAVERGYRWVTDRRSTFGHALPEALKRRADEMIASRTVG